MNLNTNNIKFLKFLAIVFLLSTSIAIATETTWRHSGFEVAGFDINLSSTFNITELRVLEWGWNSSTPSISDANRAKMYYDNNQKRIMQSIDGGAYETIVTNSTTDAINTSSNANRTWAQSLFDWFNNTALPLKADGVWLNITALPAKADGTHTNNTFAQQAINNTNQANFDNNTFVNTSNTSYVQNITILNTSTVTVGRNANGTVEFTAAAGDGSQNVTTNLLTEEIGNIQLTRNANGFIRYNRIIANKTGTVTSLLANIQAVSPTGNLRLALYSGNSTHPQTLLGESSSQAMVTGWNTLSIASSNVIEGSYYWTGLQASSADSFYYVATASQQAQTYAYSSFPAAAAAETPDTSTFNIRMSISLDSSTTDLTNNRNLNVVYTNPNSTKQLFVFVTAYINTTVSSGYALFWGYANYQNVSGKIGAEHGLINVTQQLTFIVPPKANYSVNTSTNSGKIALRDWREIWI